MIIEPKISPTATKNLHVPTSWAVLTLATFRLELNCKTLKDTLIPTARYGANQSSKMPPLLTQVARTSDGLPLVATQTPAPGNPVTSQQQQEAKDILRSITGG